MAKPPPKLTQEEALNAVRKYGTVRKACQVLGVSKSEYYRLAKVWGPEYAAQIDECRQIFLDEAEDGLWDLIQDRVPSAIYFTLKCLGYNRGWREKNHLDVTSDGDKVSVSFVPATEPPDEPDR